jgi:hypothetical protein
LQKDRKIEYLGEPTLDHESGDQLGTFSKIAVDKKYHATVPLKL